MRCIVHIWKSVEHGRHPIFVHTLPLNAPAMLQTTAKFDNEDAACARLAEIGLSPVQVVVTLHNLRDERDAMWMNVEMQEPKGQLSKRPILAA